MKPVQIVTRGDFFKFVDKAAKRTDEMAKIPDYTVPRSVRAQLDFMLKCVKDGRAPTREEKDRVQIGPIAVREFEESDPPYATLLKELDYAFSRWEELPKAGKIIRSAGLRRGRAWRLDSPDTRRR